MRAANRAFRPRCGTERCRSVRPRVPAAGCPRRTDAGASRRSIMPSPAGDKLGVETFPICKFSHLFRLCQLFAGPYAAATVGLCSQSKVRSGDRGAGTRGPRRRVTFSNSSRLSWQMSGRACRPDNQAVLCSMPAALPMITHPACGRPIIRDATCGGSLWIRRGWACSLDSGASSSCAQLSARTARSQPDRTCVPGNSSAPAVRGLQSCGGQTRTQSDNGPELRRAPENTAPRPSGITRAPWYAVVASLGGRQAVMCAAACAAVLRGSGRWLQWAVGPELNFVVICSIG